jgi:hypothetical protein
MIANTPDIGLRSIISPDGIGPIWCDGSEILRRVFVTVRDRQWREVATTRWESSIDEGRGIASLSARHVSDEVAFEWEGRLHVSDDRRELQFVLMGKALREMEVCRLGLVVLHPVESMIGSRVDSIGPQAGHQFSVAGHISPQPIVNGIPVAMTEPFSKLLIERPDFGRLELRFEGDLFELEDQRNWGDDSFKTYCTPLRLGFPHAVKAGALIVQSVEVRFEPAAIRENSRALPFARTRAHSVRDWRHEARETRNGGHRRVEPSGVFPCIGREWSVYSTPLPAQNEQATWHHIHLDIQGREGVARLQSLLESARDMKLEVGVEGGDEQALRADLVSLVYAHRERISRILIYGSRTSAPLAAEVEWWRRQHIDASENQWNAPLFAATRGYFVELNRGIPLEAPVSGIAFPFTATVHSDDAETVANNVVAIRDMADTARHLTGLGEIVVAPLALYYPRSMAARRFSGEMVRPWLAANLIHAALARISSVTLAEDMLEGVASSRSDALKFVGSLVECAGFELTPLRQTLPLGVHAAAFKSTDLAHLRILVANLNSRPIVIDLAEVGLRVETAMDAATGASYRVNDDEVEIPEFGITWTSAKTE